MHTHSDIYFQWLARLPLPPSPPPPNNKMNLSTLCLLYASNAKA